MKVQPGALLFLLLLSCMSLPLTAQSPTSLPSTLSQSLRAAKYQQRVLLVLGATAEHEDFRRQLALLATQQQGLNDRDFRVLALRNDQLSAADRQLLLRKLDGPMPAFAVLLFGKDGGVKLNRRRPVQPQELFALVDQMPMRQQEMRRQGQPK